MARIEAAPPDWIVIKKPLYADSLATVPWKLRNLRLYDDYVGGMAALSPGAEGLSSMIERLDYPLYLETATHRVYRRPAASRATSVGTREFPRFPLTGKRPLLEANTRDVFKAICLV